MLGSIKYGFSLLLLLCVPGYSIAQNLESIGREKPIALSGGISLNQVFYGSKGIENRLTLKGNFSTFIIDQDLLNVLFQKDVNTLLQSNVLGSFTTKNEKIGFVQRNYTQNLFDNIQDDVRKKFIESEISSLLKILKVED